MSSPWMAWLGLVATLILPHNVLARWKESAMALRSGYRRR